MKRILIVVIHDGIEYVSDRTLRDFLKQLGKVVRRVQLNEVERLLRSNELEPSQLQAILDRLNNEAQSLPVYFLQRIEKGSFEAEFYAAASFFGVLAASLIKKVVTDIATQNKLYVSFLKYIKGERPDTLSSLLKDALAGENIGGRFFVSDVTVTETKARIIVNVEINTPLEFEDKLPEAYTEARVIEILEAKIRETS